MARGLRLELPQGQADTLTVASRNRGIAAGNLVSAGGQRYVEEDEFETDGAARVTVGNRSDPIRISDRLPNRWALLKDQLSSLRVNEERAIDGGKQIIPVNVLEERVNRTLAINSFFYSQGERIAQVDVTAVPALKPPSRNASEEQVPLLIDDGGNQYVAVGYVFVERGQAEIRYDISDPILSLDQLPASLSAQRTDQDLTLLFTVRDGVTLERFSYGPDVRAEFRLRVGR
jgi:hypothetical protein